MIGSIKNYLETHMNEVLISIEQYKALGDIFLKRMYSAYLRAGNTFYSSCKAKNKSVGVVLLILFLFFLINLIVYKIKFWDTLCIYVFCLNLSFIKHFFFDLYQKKSYSSGVEKLNFFQQLKMDQNTIKHHFIVDFPLINVLANATAPFLFLKYVNLKINLFTYEPMFIFWVYLVILVYLMARFIIIFFANFPIKYKLINTVAGSLTTGAVTLGVGL
jgi:hypothetical protein